MRVKRVKTSGACEAITGEFVWGAQRCLIETFFVIDDADEFRVCGVHAQKLRSDAEDPR